jgi:hypothetical protein
MMHAALVFVSLGSRKDIKVIIHIARDPNRFVEVKGFQQNDRSVAQYSREHIPHRQIQLEHLIEERNIAAFDLRIFNSRFPRFGRDDLKGSCGYHGTLYPKG